MTKTLPTIQEEDKLDESAPLGSIPEITVTLHTSNDKIPKTASHAEEKNGDEGENNSMNNSILFDPQYTSTAERSSIASEAGEPPDPYDGLFEPLQITTSVKEQIREAEPNLFKYEGYWKKIKTSHARGQSPRDNHGW